MTKDDLRKQIKEKIDEYGRACAKGRLPGEMNLVDHIMEIEVINSAPDMHNLIMDTVAQASVLNIITMRKGSDFDG